MVLYYGNLNALRLHGEYNTIIERATYYEMSGTDKAEATLYNLNQINTVTCTSFKIDDRG